MRWGWGEGHAEYVSARVLKERCNVAVVEHFSGLLFYDSERGRRREGKGGALV